MIKPGLNRSIPGALIGFAAGALLVILIRQLQGVTPVVEPGVILILTPLTTIVGWLWGIGAFNPKWSEHGEHTEHHGTEGAIVVTDDDQQVEEPSALAYLFSTLWTVFTYSIVLFIVVYAIAALPLGLYVQQTTEPAAAAAAVDSNMTFAYPFGLGEFQASQLTIFLGFIGFALFSMLITGGLIGLFFVKSHEQVATVEQMEPASERGGVKFVPRFVGRASKRVARALREGLPKTLGQ
jgi:hypothetical protein